MTANHQQALALARDAGDPLAEAVSLTDLGLPQQPTGDYPAAAAGLRQPAGVTCLAATDCTAIGDLYHAGPDPTTLAGQYS